MPARISEQDREDRYIEKGEDCWPWTGALTAAGYGIFTADYTNQYAHRWMYERHVGPIPDGLTLDHLCHDPEHCAGGPECPHRHCCRPDHLAPTTRGDNVRRGSRWNSPS